MRVLVASALVGVLAASAALKGGSDAPEPQILTLGVDGRANATPWMDARGKSVALTWSATRPAGGADVFVVVSDDGGVTFKTPVRVNAVAGDARVGGELPPRVAIAASRDIVIAWGSRSDTTEIKIARSSDGGRTFQPATALQASGAKGDRGWHALTLDEQGLAHVLWLDHRGLAARPSGEHDHHKSGPDMSQFSSLYYASVGAATASAKAAPSLAEAGSAKAEAVPATQGGSAERELTNGVCYCCKTALAAGPNGQLYAAWRHVYAGNIRDIAFTMSRDNGRTFGAPSRVSRDEWEIAGCPDDGPAMTVGADGIVHLVWPTVVGGAEPQGALFYASTRDGQTFTPRQRVPTLGSPKPGHPQIALTADGQLVIAWDEIVGGVRRAATIGARVGPNGALTFDRPRTLSTDLPSSYPILARTDNGMLVAWTRGVAASAVIAVQPLGLDQKSDRPAGSLRR